MCFLSHCTAQAISLHSTAYGAMHRFMSSAASSSSGRAERPATASSSSGSAEQPATSLRSAEQLTTPFHSKILSIRDVQRWLAEEPIASCSSADTQRIIRFAAHFRPIAGPLPAHFRRISRRFLACRRPNFGPISTQFPIQPFFPN